MGFGKRTIQWIILSLLLASASAFGQNTTSVRVRLSIDQAKFLVDGQPYTSAQVFFWTIGTTHILQFPRNVLEDGSVQNYQTHPLGYIRYFLQGWSTVGGPPINSNPTSVTSILVTPDLTDVVGTISQQYFTQLRFPNPMPASAGCGGSQLAPSQDLRRQGYVLIDNVCYESDANIWLNEGTHAIEGHSYVGYAYQGFKMFNLEEIGPSVGSFKAVYQLVIQPQFTTAKRVQFRTDTPGMQVLVDHSPVTPAPVDTITQADLVNQNATCNPANTTIPVGSPLGIQQLCIGDFDFLPGSQHQIGAPDPQTDVAGRHYVFNGFSNGMGQNSTYTADSRVGDVDRIVAMFVPGIVSNFTTLPSGLQLDFDGRTNIPGRTYGFIWGFGQKHTISAPLIQTDAQGRKYRFVSWSDGGAASHQVVVSGTEATGFSAVATYLPLGQVQVTSSPLGLNVTVNGANCLTPCFYDQDPGSKMTLSAPKQVMVDGTNRRDFASWTGGATTPNIDVTLSKDLQVFSALYFTSYLVQTDSDPGDGANITISPTSPDGFYYDGTPLVVTVAAKKGFKFRHWDGDLSGPISPGKITVNRPLSIVASLEQVSFIEPAGVQNAAGDNPDHAVSPGSIISIYGNDLSSITQVGPSSPLAQAIGNVYVTIGESLLPLIFVSPMQINAQLPSTLGTGQYSLTVHSVGSPDVTGIMKVQRDAPGVFANYSVDGKPIVAALHQDGTAVSQTSPARRGEVITLYATGLGPYDHTNPDGFAIPASPVFQVVDSVSVVFNVPSSSADPLPADAAATDSPAPAPPAPVVHQPVASVAVAGMVGISQLQVKIEADLPAGIMLDLYLWVTPPQGNAALSNHVLLPMQP